MKIKILAFKTFQFSETFLNYVQATHDIDQEVHYGGSISTMVLVNLNFTTSEKQKVRVQLEGALPFHLETESCD